MAVFSVLNGTGIDGNGIHFGSIGEIAASGLAAPPLVTTTAIDISFNDGGILRVTGTGLGYDPPSDFTGTVDSLTYSKPDGTAVFTITGFSEPLAELAGLIAGGDEPAILADLFSENDTISGSSVADFLIGYDGNDVLNGGDGDDTLRGGVGADLINGGGGSDTADYQDSCEAVFVNLDRGTARGGDAKGDVLTGIENLIGSAYDDYLGGDAGANTLIGGCGNDNLAGNAGADIMDGGDGALDMADYVFSAAGVMVNLAAHTASGGDAEGDKLIGIEVLRGSYSDDVLTGDNRANILIGLGGSDTLDGGAGNDNLIGGAGADTLIGGTGVDFVRYSDAAAGVTANLGNPAVNTGDAAGDTYSGIENLLGSIGNDTLSGDKGANAIYGWNGDDIINGRGGRDVLVGGSGTDTFVFSSVSDTPVATFDSIGDFSQSQGDEMNLVGITGGKGTFIGTAAFTGTAGEVRMLVGITQTAVYIDANGDGKADAQIRLTGGAVVLTADDFVL